MDDDIFSTGTLTGLPSATNQQVAELLRQFTANDQARLRTLSRYGIPAIASAQRDSYNVRALQIADLINRSRAQQEAQARQQAARAYGGGGGGGGGGGSGGGGVFTPRTVSPNISQLRQPTQSQQRNNAQGWWNLAQMLMGRDGVNQFNQKGAIGYVRDLFGNLVPTIQSGPIDTTYTYNGQEVDGSDYGMYARYATPPAIVDPWTGEDVGYYIPYDPPPPQPDDIGDWWG